MSNVKPAPPDSSEESESEDPELELKVSEEKDGPDDEFELKTSELLSDLSSADTPLLTTLYDTDATPDYLDLILSSFVLDRACFFFFLGFMLVESDTDAFDKA